MIVLIRWFFVVSVFIVLQFSGKMLEWKIMFVLSQATRSPGLKFKRKSHFVSCRQLFFICIYANISSTKNLASSQDCSSTFASNLKRSETGWTGDYFVHIRKDKLFSSVLQNSNRFCAQQQFLPSFLEKWALTHTWLLLSIPFPSN